MNIPEFHKLQAGKHAKAAVFTISTSRSKDKSQFDGSGDCIEKLLTSAGISVVVRAILPDNEVIIKKALMDASCITDVIITTGGTGIANDDVTIRAAHPLFSKEISAFRILFIQLSYEAIGSAAMLSNAQAGIINDTACFCLPGSPDACKLALEKLILPEIFHISSHCRGEHHA